MQERIVSLPIPPCFPPTPSRIPKKILFQGFLRVEARSPLTNLPCYADRLLSNYCLLCDVIPNVPCAGFIQENYVNKPRGAHWECWHAKESMVTVSCSR